MRTKTRGIGVSTYQAVCGRPRNDWLNYVAFEQFLDSFFKGDFGQYFTPREIIQSCVEELDPKSDDTILDPAFGSGGFLLHAMDHVRHQAERLYEDDETARLRHWHHFARDRLFGIEINDEISRVAKMNMILPTTDT